MRARAPPEVRRPEGSSSGDGGRGPSTSTSAFSLGVVDNLHMHLLEGVDETTYFLDVADVFSNDERLLHRECIEHLEPDVCNESLSFLAPRYFPGHLRAGGALRGLSQPASSS